MLCKPIRCFIVLFDGVINCWHFRVWVTDEWKKEGNRWDYIDRRNVSSRTATCAISNLCKKNLQHWETCDWTHVSMFRNFKDLIQIWIFIYSKWQKINRYTLTGNGTRKFMLKFCHQLCENIFVLSVAIYCNEQFICIRIITCIRWMLQIQYNFKFYTFEGPLAQSQQPKIYAFIRDD
jgi:hypothetical protein